MEDLWKICGTLFQPGVLQRRVHNSTSYVASRRAYRFDWLRQRSVNVRMIAIAPRTRQR